MPDATTWITVNRSSHDRLAGLVVTLSEAQARGQSYDQDWTIADVVSHLGSQAEIFGLFLDATVAGTPVPGPDAFGPIWDRWNALSPAEQIRQSVVANEVFVQRLEKLTEEEKAAFPAAMFGQELELSDMLAMRLGEHAVHVWDVAVALDPATPLAPDAVELLIDGLPSTAARVGKPVEGAEPITVATSAPDRRFLVTLAPEVSVAVADPDPQPGDLQLPAEAFIRLVYGRLDPDHTPGDVAGDARLGTLRSAFPGF
jgi:uncharacterized protein (TIGR03083 family)